MKPGQFRLPAIPQWQPTVAVIAVICYLTLMPQPLRPDVGFFEGADKVVHFLMFGGLTGTVIFDRWRVKAVGVGMRFALCAAAASILFGLFVEWAQDAMQLGRTGRDPYDALANTLGALTAIPVTKALGWVSRKK